MNSPIKHVSEVAVAEFAQPLPPPSQASPVTARSSELLNDIAVTLEVKLGEAVVSIQQLFDLKDGSVVALNRLVDEPVDVLLNGKLVARGQLVASGDQFGVRITDISHAEAQ